MYLFVFLFIEGSGWVVGSGKTMKGESLASYGKTFEDTSVITLLRVIIISHIIFGPRIIQDTSGYFNIFQYIPVITLSHDFIISHI